MSKDLSRSRNDELVEELEELDAEIAAAGGTPFDEISDDDYGFILDAEGNLKSVFIPEDYDEIPEKVYAIFKLFGIEDIDEIHARIGHVIH